jgi:N-acetylglucosaminyl-diphospho-decaprenol L-rhamnosyltransferase
VRMHAPCELTVAVVTWNSGHHLPGFIAALPAGLAGVTSWRLVVADNGSTDSTCDLLSKLAPDAMLLALGRNLGFAAGVNAAIAACRPSRAVLILNPDVRLGEGMAVRLLDALGEPGNGIAVPRLLGSDGRLHYSLRREPTVVRMVCQALLGRRAGRLSALGEVVSDPASYERPCRVDWATGAVTMVSRSCLDAVGPWDESYFLYSEETDFALRSRDQGFATCYVPRAVAAHLGGDSEHSPRLWSMLTLNRVRLFSRRHGPARSAAFRSAVIVNEGLRSLLPGRPEHRAALRALLFPAHRPKETAL